MKSLKEMTFTDDFMFCTVIENKPDIAKQMLELILDKKISKVKFVDKQKTLNPKFGNRGVRLDVYLQDEKDKVYNIEMQTSPEKNLPKRSRYYHSMIDLDQLKSGGKYDALRETYVIFICKFPLYGDSDEPVYLFEKRCATDLQKTLNDGSITVLVNACCKRDDISDTMKAFLQYVSTGKEILESDLTRQIDEEVRRIKSDEYLEVSYMLVDEKFEEAIEKGFKQGALANLVSLVKKNLLDIKVAAEEAGMSVEEFEKLLGKED